MIDFPSINACVNQIDLHTHTCLSDGRDSPDVLLQKAEDAGVGLLSITDHNHCLAYGSLNRSLFKGPLLPGCEMATSFEGHIIELLGYGVNPSVINQWYNDFYSASRLAQNEARLFSTLQDCSDRLGLTRTHGLTLSHIEKGISKRTIYQDLIRYPENAAKLPDGLLESYRTFFRQGLANPESPIFAAEHLLYTSIKDTLALIKKAGGLAFLAHLFEYRVRDSFAFLARLCNEVALDGIECFHSSFSTAQSNDLLAYTRREGLFVSGGSDYHGKDNGVRLGEAGGHPISPVSGMEWLATMPLF